MTIADLIKELKKFPEETVITFESETDDEITSLGYNGISMRYLPEDTDPDPTVILHFYE